MTKQSVHQHEIQVTVDIVVLTVDDQKLKVLLIQRGIAPFKGQFALPGGFVLANETLDAAAFRELSEETGTENVYLEQLYTFGDPKRDPRRAGSDCGVLCPGSCGKLSAACGD